MADIYNTANDTLLSGTSGADSIQNGGRWDDTWHDGGSSVTINGGRGLRFNWQRRLLCINQRWAQAMIPF